MRSRGIVKWFDENRGRGFIRDADDGRDVYVGYADIDGEGWRTLAEGEKVEYDLAPHPAGVRAVRLRRVPAGRGTRA